MYASPQDKCTLMHIEMHLGKWLHFKKPSCYHQSKNYLNEGHCTLFVLYRPRLYSIVGVSLMPNHDLWFTNKKQSVIGRHFSILAKLKAGKRLPKCKF